MGIKDVTIHQEQRERTNGQVEVEDPAPAVVVGDPTAECWAEDWGEKNTDAEGRHGMTVTLLRKSLEQNGLGERLEPSAGQTLQHAEDDELRQRGGHAATERGDRESGNASEEKALAAEMIRQPSRNRKHDCV